MSVIQSFQALQPIQKIFLVIALATVFCSIFTDCLLCKYWPVSFSAHWHNPLENFKEAQDTLYAFTVDWCGHCRASAPEFDQLASLYANDPKINFKKVNAETDGAELAKSANVTGYPSIQLNKNGKWINYSGQREAAAIKAWADAQ